MRIVRFPGSDTCACCGTHVRRTGEVGLVKLLSIQKFRAGVRIEMCAGGRALAWLNTQAAQNHQISVALSAKAEETAAAVGRLQEELFAERGRLSALEQALFSSLARSSAAAAGAPVFVPGLSADSLCRLADAILSENGRAAVFSGDDSAGYRYALGSRDGDIRPLVRELSAALSGRGGGKPGFAQGFLAAKKDGIDAFFAARSGWAFG